MTERGDAFTAGKQVHWGVMRAAVTSVVMLAACRFAFDEHGDGSMSDGVLAACPRTAPSAGMGVSHTCVVKLDGTLWCAGQNYGLTFVRVGGDSDWESVDTAEFFTCARKTDCTLWCWGPNSNGELGLGDTLARSQPTSLGPTKWKQYGTGRYHSCAIRDDGALFCWGEATYGALGLGETSPNRMSPTRVGQQTWSRLGRGGQFMCALDATGALYCWGDNEKGQMGNGTLGDLVLVPMLVTAPAHTTGWRAIAGGKDVLCVLHTDGTIWCTGENDNGECGLGTRGQQTLLGQVAGNTWTALAAGRFHMCAIRSDQTLWCWGDNQVASVGVPGALDYLMPQQLTMPAAWSEVVPMNTGSCAFAATGSVYCWGENVDGQLGFGDTATRTSPTIVPL